MIKVLFYRDQAKLLIGFNVTGHAMSAPHGSDIICAGVSVLTQGTIIGLEEVVTAKLEKSKADGFLRCIVTGNYMDNGVQILLKTLYLSIKDLVNSYPDYIHLNEERRVLNDEN